MAKKKRQFRKFKPFVSRGGALLIGDYRGTEDRDAHGRYIPRQGMERIDYNYPDEPGGLEEGIMGIPAWALLLGAVVIGGLYLKYR